MTVSTSLYATSCILGLVVIAWSHYSLPDGFINYPVPIREPTNRGPYRFLRHPMYIGNLLLVTSLGGLGGGFWNALAFFTLAEMMFREWAWRENGRGW